MHDDSNPNFDDITRDTSDPNAETHHEDKASGSWLDTNVGVRADEWIGRRIGEFEIIRIIGMGGMGNVYEAKQIHPHRSVALKIVKSAAATPATLHRFEMESELLARLQHPGIAQRAGAGQRPGDRRPRSLWGCVQEIARRFRDYDWEPRHLDRGGGGAGTR